MDEKGGENVIKNVVLTANSPVKSGTVIQAIHEFRAHQSVMRNPTANAHVALTRIRQHQDIHERSDACSLSNYS
jgi:hypothetical protein